MSGLQSPPDKSTTTEATTLANLTALSVSASGEFIRKTGVTTFENATPEGGGGATWGAITGTLSNQTDLQAALDAKGTGNVTKVGTPVNNQIGVWTGDGTIEGTTGLTYNGTNFQLTGDIGSTATRITKGWFTDLEVTNAILGGLKAANTSSGVLILNNDGVTVASFGVGSAASTNIALSGTVALGANNITMTGSLGTTGAGKLTKVWATDIESTNEPTINGTALSSATITFSNKTLTAPKFADLGFIADANGNELLIMDTVASAVNEITLKNAATTTNPGLTATGGDANVGIDVTLKGTGTFNIKGNATQPGELRLYEDTDLGTNFTAFKVGTQAADISYVLPTAQGAASTTLTNDGSGNLSWAAAAGGGSTTWIMSGECYSDVALTTNAQGWSIYPVYPLTDSASDQVNGSTTCPSGKTGISAIRAYYYGAGVNAGDIVCEFSTAKLDPDTATNLITADNTTTATTIAGVQNGIGFLDFPADSFNAIGTIAEPDLIAFYVKRLGANGSDTYSSSIDVLGFRITWS